MYAFNHNIIEISFHPCTPQSFLTPGVSILSYPLKYNDQACEMWPVLNNWSVDPESAAAFYWKAAVILAVIYNCIIVITRMAFEELRDEPIFLALDILCDVIYVLDLFVEARTSFLSEGLVITEARETWQHFKQQSYFRSDLLAICPIQIISWIIGSFMWLLPFYGSTICGMWSYAAQWAGLRINRLLKYHTMEEFFQKTESRTNKPNILRAFKLGTQLSLVIHWFACLYYMLSEYEGLGSNDWVYPKDPVPVVFSRKYIKCMFWSVMTLTTIGERPPPQTEVEYIFTGLTFLIGVFVFAAVVGNVGDVISNMNAARRDFQARMDQIKFFMDHRKVPEHLQNRVKRWAEYTWSRTNCIDEPSVLQLLPDRLRTEVAIHVHLDVLKKVSIFKDCEEGLLRELVLKLRPQIFSPGDYICRIGEIGRDMYIINHGKVEILFPEEETGLMKQVSVMHPGGFFGEISLLKLDEGHNRLGI
ncbi:cyclic nucleotide-gated cation channel [Plakobranchus ocellatus]|uniref:Cyclic nucleotide-gated cation channel n=1 Tax=Plakobranchus ocellatus TaxID=259542 RepID=A0AAV4CFP4_9GAST|nr:cyclic nucleotide-gated cation channel [Plakobranchus ocellatus]